MLSKIVIGTAQFSSSYGISNTSGNVQSNTIKKILLEGQKLGIQSIDTAIDYQNCHQELGHHGVGNYKIITKIPKVPINEKNIDLIIQNHIEKSCNDLNVSTIDTLLIHRPDQLKDKLGKSIIRSLEKHKSLGVINKIGVSIYDPSELASIVNFHNLDVVQCPINIFDRRMQLSGWLKKLRKLDIEIHARSVFLQGLLLMENNLIPNKFDKWNHLFKKWDNYNNNNVMDKIKTSLQYVLSLKEINKIVLGFQNENELKQVSKLFKYSNCIFPETLYTTDEMLLNPNNWSKL